MSTPIPTYCPTTQLEDYRGRALKGRAFITLASGETFSAIVPCRFWKSRLMDRMPYGTVYMGATWRLERI